MKNKIYQVPTNLNNLVVREIEIVKKTDSYYWKDEKTRDALNTMYHKSFDTKDEAINHLRFLLEQKIKYLRDTLTMYHKKLGEFETLYNK